MSAGTPIQWCDDTCNPTSGCDGCELFRPLDPDKATCYARVVHLQRLTKAPALKATGYYAPAFSEVRMIPGRVAEAARRKSLYGTQRDCKGWLDALPRVIFVGDLSDIFSRAVTDEFLEREVFAPMEGEHGRRHIWIVLTKRPQRMAEFSRARPGGLPRNVCAMTSVTDRRTYQARVPHLLRVEAAYRGLSCEPLLEDIAPCMDGLKSDMIQWVICGGESGPQARPCDLAWVRGIVRQARSSGVAPFLKQLGARPIDNWTRKPLLLRDSKGGDWNEWPDHLRVRQMPDFSVIVAEGNNKPMNLGATEAAAEEKTS
jgi:protein gp37